MAWQISQFVRSLLFEHGIDATAQVTGAGTHGLGMVFAIVNHLAVVQSRELYVPLPGHVGVLIKRGFDELGARLGNPQAFGLRLAALLAGRYQATQTAELGTGAETGNVLDERQVNGSTEYSNAIDSFEVAVGIELAIKREDELLFEFLLGQTTLLL